MSIPKMYAVTLIEIIVFLLVGFILAETLLSKVYERFGIAYLGNEGVMWFRLSFFLFCLFTLIRAYILSDKSSLLSERVTSFTFWIVFIWSIYSVFSPFVKGEI